MMRQMMIAAMAALLSLTAGAALAASEKEEDVAYTDVPAAVRTAFEKDYPNVEVQEVEKETVDGKVVYEFEFKNAEGKKREVTYSLDGKKMGDDKDDD